MGKSGAYGGGTYLSLADCAQIVPVEPARGLSEVVVAHDVVAIEVRPRLVSVVCAAIALYVNVFVGVVQAFQKVPALTAIAPKQTEPPFVVMQLAVPALFIALTIVAAKRFRGAAVRTA